jgi:hypothetical protein
MLHLHHLTTSRYCCQQSLSACAARLIVSRTSARAFALALLVLPLRREAAAAKPLLLGQEPSGSTGMGNGGCRNAEMQFQIIHSPGEKVVT